MFRCVIKNLKPVAKHGDSTSHSNINKNLGRLGITHANRMEKLSVLSPE
jgi:hypothetical protein